MGKLTQSDVALGVIDALAAEILKLKAERDSAWNEAIEAAAREANVFQDLVGWHPDRARNRLVGEIEERIRELKRGAGAAPEKEEKP